MMKGRPDGRGPKRFVRYPAADAIGANLWSGATNTHRKSP